MGDRAVRCGGGGVAAARWWLAGGAAAKTPSPQAEALAMSCSVAIPSSPVFSPSRRPLSCKAASASPESVSVSSPAPSTAGSPLRPFRLLRAQIREEASPSPKTSSAAPSVAAGSVLKRRRPALLMVPVDGAADAAAAVAAVASVESDPSNEVEEEGEEFAAYCRRGRGRRRVEMEDRHVAKVALGGDPEVIRRRQPLRQRRRWHHRRRSTISCQCERRDGGEDGCSWCACAQWRRKGLGRSVGAEGRRCGRIVSMAATPRRSEWSRTY